MDKWLNLLDLTDLRGYPLLKSVLLFLFAVRIYRTELIEGHDGGEN